MDVHQGEIFWIDIPQKETKGSEQYGRRPFVVMSRDAVNRRLKTVVVVPLTTYGGQLDQKLADQLASQPPFRILIPPTEITRDVLSNTEIVVCVAKTDQARVVSKERLLDKMGKLSTTAMIAVGAGLAFLLDIR